jgi:putative transcriptional regulator
MTIMHHPTVETLIDLVTGRLDLGRSIVVAAHVEICPTCAHQSRLMNTVGGSLLAAATPEQMSPGAAERAFARIDAHPGEAAEPPPKDPPSDLPFLPKTALQHAMGDWQWIGPGIHRRMFELPDDSGARVFLLKAQPGTRMPDHTHTGSELTLVLSGAFGHEHGRFGSGDFEEADSDVEHQPTVEAGEDCICLVAMEGSLKLKGLTGRLLQPFIRI